MILNNSFIVDINKDKKEILYKDIKQIVVKNNSILLNETKLDFKHKNSLDKFYNLLQDKLNDE